MQNRPIGIFDSGIGGLTVYKAIKNKIPQERVIYLGDTARLPYGTKSPDTIRKFSLENSEFLMSKDVKMIVIACNSSASHAERFLRERFDIPVLGVIGPGSEAALSSNSKKIGVIGTAATISSGAYSNRIRELDPQAEVISKSCPLFVPLVEEGWIDHEVTRLVAEEYLESMRECGIGSLVLGCTHYPVLKGVIGKVMGSNIELIDSAEVMAEKIEELMNEYGWLNGTGNNPAGDEFYVTDFPDRFKEVGEIFLQRKIDFVKTIDL